MVSTYYFVKLLQNSNSKKVKKKTKPELHTELLQQTDPLLTKNQLSKRRKPDKNKNELELKQQHPNENKLKHKEPDNKFEGKLTQQPSESKIKFQSSIYPIILQQCRVCLEPGSEPVLYKYHNSIPFSLCLKYICDIDIHVNDIYPKYLCESCCKTLIAAMTLRNTARKSQSKLIKMYSSSQTLSGQELSEVQKLANKLNSSNQNTINSYSKPDCKKKSEPYESISLQSEQDEGNILDVDFEYSNTKVKHERQSVLEEYNLDSVLQQEDETSVFLKTSDVKVEFPKYYNELFIDGKGISFECQICNKVIQRGNRSQHLRIHLTDLQYICEMCGKSTRTLCQMKLHRETHTNILKYKCNNCPYVGRVKDNLRVHINRMHIRKYTYACTQCSKKFLDSQSLKRHKLRHDKPKVQCDKCQRLFYEKSMLKAHIQINHSDENPHKCDICGIVYMRRKSLLVHQIKVHNRKKVYNNRANYLRLKNVTITNNFEN